MLQTKRNLRQCLRLFIQISIVIDDDIIIIVIIDGIVVDINICTDVVDISAIVGRAKHRRFINLLLFHDYAAHLLPLDSRV